MTVREWCKVAGGGRAADDYRCYCHGLPLCNGVISVVVQLHACCGFGALGLMALGLVLCASWGLGLGSTVCCGFGALGLMAFMGFRVL